MIGFVRRKNWPHLLLYLILTFLIFIIPVRPFKLASLTVVQLHSKISVHSSSSSHCAAMVVDFILSRRLLASKLVLWGYRRNRPSFSFYWLRPLLLLFFPLLFSVCLSQSIWILPVAGSITPSRSTWRKVCLLSAPTHTLCLPRSWWSTRNEDAKF